MSRAEHVLVVGGGIAGLATARALHRHGIECDVIERRKQWTHPGAGMYLPANSLRALDRLGLRCPCSNAAAKWSDSGSSTTAGVCSSTRT